MGRIILLLLLSGTVATIGSKYFSNDKTRSMKLNAGIVTARLAETKEFYQQLLGFGIRFESDWFLLMHTPEGEEEIAFLLPDHPSQAAIFRPPFNGKGVFITIEVSDVDAEYQRIKDLDVPVVVELKDEEWGDRHFAILDPNGIGVDIVTHTRPSE